MTLMISAILASLGPSCSFRATPSSYPSLLPTSSRCDPRTSACADSSSMGAASRLCLRDCPKSNHLNLPSAPPGSCPTREELPGSSPSVSPRAFGRSRGKGAPRAHRNKLPTRLYDTASHSTPTQALHRPISRGRLSPAQGVLEPRAIPPLPEAAHDRGRQGPIRLGRSGPALPGRLRRHRHRLRRPLPPIRAGSDAQTERDTSALLHDLPAPEHRRVRARPGRKDARRSQGLLLRQLRL